MGASLKYIHKRLLRRLGRKVFYAMRMVARCLPYWFFKIIEPVFIAIANIFLRRRKDVVYSNLHIAFGNNKSSREIKQIARSWFRNIGLGMTELIYLIDRPEEIKKRVDIEGREHLETALGKGRGVILLSAHFGNFALMLLWMGLAGYKTSYIMRRMKDEEFSEYVYDYCSERGVQTIYSLPFRECIEQSFNSLRDNQLLFILLDQNYGERSGIFVDFFGRPAATATGPVVFSNRSGAPVLPAFIVRTGVNRHKIIIEEPVNFEAAQDEKSSLMQNTAHLTKIIEGYISRYPHEWGGWMHMRWKSAPFVNSQ